MARFFAQLALLVTTSLFVYAVLKGPPVESDSDLQAYTAPTHESRRLYDAIVREDAHDPPPGAKTVAHAD